MSVSSESSTDQRVVRIFVSSTFQDMKEEREILVKRVFPQLGKICEERQVTWGEVDLRWGVTEEQKAEGKVLPICLEEIRRCRPYFIGLLGERYGWIPDEIPKDLIERELWLRGHLSHSVTELEILHGVLNNPDMAEHAFFYFRDPEYLNHLPEGTNPFDFISEGETSKAKLTALKEKIRKSKTPVRENYANPKALEELVLHDLTGVINKLFPLDEKIDPLDRDALDHEAYAGSRAQVYIGGTEYLERLNKHAQRNETPLVVLGESGIGKSALLANWALKYRKNHPDNLVIMHFIGASPYSTDWQAMLRRIMGELKRHFDIQQELPDKPDELRSAFPNWLYMASAKGKVILILDALNQLEDHDGAPDLAWLPPVIPENIRLIFSTLPGRPLDELKRRVWLTDKTVLTVVSLTKAKRQRFIEDYLDQYGKKLSPMQADRIASRNQTANPLYLRTLLEELRVYGDQTSLSNRIEHYLTETTVEGLFSKALARWEVDYDPPEHPGMIREAMTLLWAARRGLSESEIKNLLGKDGQPLPHAFWSPFYLAAGASLMNRSGLITFFHDYLRRAVKNRYIPQEENEKQAHLRLAHSSAMRILGERALEELPWQLSQAREWARLYMTLSFPPFLAAACQANNFEMRTYWAQIEVNSPQRLIEAYRPVLESPHQFISSADSVAELFFDTGHWQEAQTLWSFLVSHFKETNDPEKLLINLNNLTQVLFRRGELDQALKICLEAETICRKQGNLKGLQYCLSNRALILKTRGDLHGAMTLLKEGEDLCRRLKDLNGLSFCMGYQALIHRAWGELEEALALHREEEGFLRELGNKSGLMNSLGNQAAIHYFQGDLKKAMALYEQVKGLSLSIGHKEILQSTLGNQAVILKTWGRLKEALDLHKEEERLCRELGSPDGLGNSLGNQANIYYTWGRWEEAMALHKKEENLWRELGHKASLSNCLLDQAKIYIRKGDLESAMTILREQEQLCRSLGAKRDLSKSLGLQGRVHEEKGELEKALELVTEQERLCREIGDKQDIAISLGMKAGILNEQGDSEGAQALYQEMARLCREVGDRDMLQRALSMQANIAQEKGDQAAALALLREQEEVCREGDLPEGLTLALVSQAILEIKAGKLEQAMVLIQDSYRLTQEHVDAVWAPKVKAIIESIIRKLGAVPPEPVPD